MASSPLQKPLDELDLTPLTAFMEQLAAEIKTHAKQGANDAEWRDAQAFSVAEEAGEFVGEYRRWRGFARRAGNRDDLLDELADVTISSFIMFANLDADAQAAIKKKLQRVITRGYINKPE